ncbi:hypothetical protein B0H16DRAFT_479437 [Mycena metata]|uniref:Uncharacterized protein n=1 Tax=Mycena metata TaxID=1033252 RepID=A0AAD7KD51_9AGAR|nr:hypothetical protein B0H16DRAFT_479437 [Mycena metata]
MGRRQYSIVQEEQNILFKQAQQDPSGEAAKHFYGYTTDPTVSFCRRRLDSTIQRAVESLPITLLPAPAPRLIAGPTNLPRRPLQEREVRTEEASPETIRTFTPPLVTSSQLPAVLGIPVVFADAIVANTTVVLRYAILGPNIPGMLWQNRIVQLTNGDYSRARVVKNHGVTIDKPSCTIVEAEYDYDGVVHTKILLAANYLIHSSFEEEIIPDRRYTGDQVQYLLTDRISTLHPLPVNYGVSVHNYYSVTAFTTSPPLSPPSSSGSEQFVDADETTEENVDE